MAKGILSDEREKFAFGTTQIAKFITQLVKKSSTPKQFKNNDVIKDYDFAIKKYENRIKNHDYEAEIESLGGRDEFATDELRELTPEFDKLQIEMLLKEKENIIKEALKREVSPDELKLSFDPEEQIFVFRPPVRTQKQDGGKLQNPEKADLDNDGELSSYEEARGEAIEENMRESKQVGGMMMDDQMADMMEEENKMPMDNQMADMMPEEKTEEQKAIEEAQAPDEMMEENYVDFLIDEALSDDEEAMLMQELQANPQLSMLFDKVMEVAMEFSGSGPVEGPGTEVSDSIPARLSDGEFVFTAKSVDVLGADNLMSLMKQAEAQADQRQMAQDGGLMEEEDTAMPVQQEPVRQDIRVTKETVDSQAAMQDEEDLVGDEIKKSMLSGRPHVRS